MRWKKSILLTGLVTHHISVDSFQIQRQEKKLLTTRIFSETYLLSLEKTAVREIDQFQEWSYQCGVQTENGFTLSGQIVDGNEDWCAVTSTGATQGSRVLYVPGEMILSGNRIAQEYHGYVDSCLEILKENEMLHLSPKFHVFLKILVEYEQGVDSPYYNWLAALPRKWNTAASLDYFCMSTLPPYIKKVCQAERDQKKVFQKAVQSIDYLSPETKANDELMKFAYNIVVSRSWPDTTGVMQNDCLILPGADYFNHDYPGNVALEFNERSGDWEIFLTKDVTPGEALTLCYGSPTNPSLLLAKYGFLNEAPATYCKILFTNPSQKLIDVGYDPERMVIYTADGSIAQEVWDVLLYSKLERTPGMAEAKNAFYEAHMSGDEETKSSIHRQFQRATCEVFLSHVENILKEVNQLSQMMIKFQNDEKHPRLPLLFRHHEMVKSTFLKARDYTINILSNS